MNGFMSPRPHRAGSVSARSLSVLALALAGWLSGAAMPALFAQESEAPMAPPALPSEAPAELLSIEEAPAAKPVVARPVKPLIKKPRPIGVRAARPLPATPRPAPAPADSVWAEPVEEELEAPVQPIRQVQGLVPNEGLEVDPIEGTEPLAPLGEAVPYEPGQVPALDAAPLMEEVPLEEPGFQVTPDEQAPLMEETEPAPLKTRAGQPQRMPTNNNFNRTVAAELVPYNERGAAPPAGGFGAQDQIHIVTAGENFWTISKKHYRLGRYSAALAEYNKSRIPKPDKINPGMKVVVPPVETLEQKYETLIFGVSAAVSKEEAAAPVKSGFFVDANGEPMYRVGEGDTLSTIAQDHLGRSSRYTQIIQLNPVALKNPDAMKLGMVLRLPANASEAVQTR